MNRRRVVLVVVIVLGMLGLSAFWWGPRLGKQENGHVPAEAAEVSVPPNAVQVAVRVYDGETLDPINGAQIRAGQGTATTQGGECTLELGSGITHTLSVRAARYLEQTRQVYVDCAHAGQVVVEVALFPNSAIGKVTGVRERPLVDAQVTLNGQPVPVDATGGFVLHRVERGDVITVSHPGYAPYETTFEQSPLQIVLSPLTATLQVLDRITGQAISGAEVCKKQDCVQTDEQGKAVIDEAAPGLALSVVRQGYQTYRLTCDDKETMQVELSPRMLTGVVRNVETGRPLTNTVLLVDGQITPVDASGRYTLTDLSRVNTLFVKTPGFKRVTIPFAPELPRTARYDSLDPCLEPTGLPCADLNLTPFAVHGIYINFNLLMWDRKRVLELIDMVDRSPILNAIVVDVKSDRGFVALDSEHLPENVRATPRLLLSEFISLCKERHIYTIARMVIFKDNELIKARPELAVRHPNGEIFYDREGMAWGDPTRTEVWDYNIMISKEMVALGFDEIQYDYLRYPSDSTSLEIVRALVYSIPYSLESRVGAISGFIQAAQKAIDETPAFLSADIFGYALVVTPEFDMRIGQRLIDIAPVADYVCPMIYPSTFEPGNLGLAQPSKEPYTVIDISLRYALERAPTTIIRPWLQHYWYDRFQIAEQRRAAEALIPWGWCYWNAGAKYDELFFVPPPGLEP